MFNNNLKVAWRHLLKNKFTTAINLLGLITGMTAALLIWEYVHYERSYDTFHEKADRIYRIRTDRVKDGVTFMQFASGTAAAANVLKNNFAEVEDYVKLRALGEGVFSKPDNDNVVFREKNVYFATPSLFDVFSFPLLEGDPKNSLAEPFTACLSKTSAKKMFGNENPIGKTITWNGRENYKITGIFADSPSNSHIKFDALLSYITFSDVFNKDGVTETAMLWDGYLSYVLLKPNTDWKALEAKIPAAIEKTYDAEISKAVVLYLQPLKDIHLTSNYLAEAEVNGDGNAVRFLFIIGIIVLLIAWINYINLSTARSELRAREVGVRKVVGSSRKSLIGQFLTEAAVINVFAIIVSFILVRLLHPFFEQLTDKTIPISLFSNANFFFLMLAVLLMGTLLTGLYPAFLLSSFKPLAILKSGFSSKSGDGTNNLRKGLVVVQFIISVGLIASTMIIYSQLNYMQETKLGLNIDQTLILKGPQVADSTFTDKSQVFKQAVEQLATVKKLSGSTSIPGQAFGWTAGGVHRVGAQEDEAQNFHVMAADVDYSQLYEMELVAGRHMSKDMGTDNMACLLNETGTKLLFNSPEEAIGQMIEFWGERFTIAGVLKDFHQESPKAVVEPLILRPLPSGWTPQYYSVKLSTQQLPQTLGDIETAWAQLFPGNPFDYFFLDDHFNQQYASDQRFGKIFTLFSVLAIFVSCLGLFALVTFVAERRKKEIGVRKVLGATTPNLVVLLSKDFLWLVVIALLIATPLTWYFLDGWLDNFVTRIDIPWWIFALAGVLAIGIALLTVSFQSAKAALTSPMESLRSE